VALTNSPEARKKPRGLRGFFVALRSLRAGDHAREHVKARNDLISEVLTITRR
jgi:hypothetical protein